MWTSCKESKSEDFFRIVWPFWNLIVVSVSLLPRRGSNFKTIQRFKRSRNRANKNTQSYQYTWWRHQMEIFSALLAICAGNSPVPGEFPAQRPVTRSFDVFFDLRLNKRLSEQSWGWWFETTSRPLWCHCNGIPIINIRRSRDSLYFVMKIYIHRETVFILKRTQLVASRVDDILRQDILSDISCMMVNVTICQDCCLYNVNHQQECLQPTTTNYQNAPKKKSQQNHHSVNGYNGWYAWYSKVDPSKLEQVKF